MRLSAELTFYPFTPDFKLPIKDIIRQLNTYSGVRVETFPTASVVMGEHDAVMAALSDCMRWSYEKYGRCVFLAKFLPGYAALAE